MYFYKMKTLHLKLLLLEKNQFNLGKFIQQSAGLARFQAKFVFYCYRC